MTMLLLLFKVICFVTLAETAKSNVPHYSWASKVQLLSPIRGMSLKEMCVGV